MQRGCVRLFRLTRARPLRALSAFTLALSVASTGAITLAAPAAAVGPPPAILTSPTPATDRGTTPSWTFSEPGAVECAFGEAAASRAFAACTSPFTAPALTTDGTYVFEVRNAGDTTASTGTYTLDTVAQVTVAAPAPNPGRDQDPHWTIGVETNGAALCGLDGDPVTTSCTTGFDATGLTAGVHTLSVTATDEVPGNTGSATSTYTVDLTPPGQPTVTGSSGLGSTVSVGWSWTVAAGETSACTLTTPVGTGIPASCPGGTFNQTIGTPGAYGLSVVVTDAAGNTSPAGASPTYTYDNTPATAAVITEPAKTPDVDRTPTWAFSTPEALVGCTLTGPAGFTAVTSSCTAGTFTPPTSLTLDGAYRLAVTTTTPAGNAATATSGDYVLDTTGPDAPVISSPVGLFKDPKPTFAYTGEMPTSAFCTLVRTAPTALSTGPVACDAGYSQVLPGDGTYHVDMHLVDALGNVGATARSGDYVLDTTAPATPVLTGVPTVGKDPSPAFLFATETGGSSACWFTTTTTTSAVDRTCQDGSYQPAFPTDTTYTVHVVVTDAAGNDSVEGSQAYTLDSRAPGAPTVTDPASPGKSRAPLWTLASDGDSTLGCRLLTGPTVLDGPVPCDAAYQADLSLPAADGTHTLEITATDPALNTTVVTSTYVLDTAAPTTPVVTGPPSPGNATTPAWTFPVQAGTTATCQLVQGMSTSAWTDCSLGRYTASFLADGSYQVYVKVTDLALNDSPLGISALYRSDRTAPAAPTVVSPPSPGNDPAPAWTWTGEAGATATCRLDRAGVIGTALPCNGGTFAPGLSGDSTYVVVVQLLDAAGNASTPTTTPVYVLDTAKPVKPVVSGPTGTANNSKPVWTFTSEAGGLVRCRLVRDGTAGTASACTSGAQVTLPGNGVYVYEVVQTDDAGNVSLTGQSQPYTFDGTAPAAPTVTAPSSPSKAVRPQFAFGAEALSATECRVLRATALVQDWTACTSPFTADLTGLPDASYTVEVRATDAAGNTGPAGSSLAYALDTTAPDPPVVSGPAGPATDVSPTWTWASGGNASLCQLSHDGVLDPTTTACSSPWNPTLAGDGRWLLQVSLRDGALNTGAAGASGVYVLDTTAPVAPVVTAPPSPGRNTRPSWSVAAEPATSAQCQVTTDTGAVVSAFVPCTLPVSTDLSGQADGTYVLSVVVTDTVGLTGPAGSASYLLDTTAPAAPVFTPPVPTTGRSPALSFPFTAETGATVACTLTSGASTLSSVSPCASPVPVNLGGLADGTYTLGLTATDRAGNNSATQTATYVFDTAPPAAPVLVSGPAPTSPDRTPRWTFTAEANATVTCRLTGSSGTVVPDTTCVGSFQPDLSARPDDTYVFTATATDRAGNTSTSALTSTYVLDATAPATADVVPPVSPGRSTSPTWAVSTTDGTVQCRLAKGALVLRDFADCPASYTPDLSGTGDGVYTFTAHVVDAAGNVSPDVVSRYRLDTVPPATAVLITPVSPSTDRMPTWTVSSPDTNATARCEVLGASGTVVKPFAACAVSAAGSPYTLDLTGRADGPYTLAVHLTDAAGNQAAVDATGTYLLDTSAPNTVLVTPPASPASATTPTWALIGDADAVLECRLSTPTVPGTFAPCLATPGVPGSGSFTANLTTLADGTYTLGVRSRDAAGNVGAETTSGYVLDRAAPATPAALGAPASPARAAVISWTFSIDPDAQALCLLSSATAVVAPEQPCSSPWVTDLGQFGDGDYALAVRAVDAAGNGSGSVSSHYVLDRTPSAPPVFTNNPGSPSPDQTPTWSIQLADDTDTLECLLVGSASPVWGTCTSPAVFDLSASTGGTFTLQVRETDAAGNVSAVTTAPDYVLDLTAPAPPDVFAPTRSRSNSLAPVFRIVRQEGDVDTVSLLCKVTRFDLVTTSVASPCAFGDTTVALAGLTGDGPVVLSVQTVDLGGNISAPASATYSFDDRPPGTPTLLGPNPSVSFDREAAWTFGGVSDADHYVCELRKTGASGPANPVLCPSPHTVTIPSFGSWTFSVWAVDKAGNTSTAAVSQTYVYLPPVPTLPAARGPVAGSDSTPTWTFSVPLGFTAQCLLGLPGGQALTYDCSTPVTATRTVALLQRFAELIGPSQPSAARASSFTGNLEGRTAGTYTFALRLIDAYGHVGDYSPRSSYRYTPAVAGPGPIGGGGTTPSTPGRPGPGSPPSQPTGQVDGGAGGTPTVVAPDRGNSAGSTGTGNGVTAAPATRTRTGIIDKLGLPSPPPFNRLPGAITRSLADGINKPTIPLLLLFVVVGFLLLQNQIDRRDPKLASAPVGAEPELDFGPAVRRSNPGLPGTAGGALA